MGEHLVQDCETVSSGHLNEKWSQAKPCCQSVCCICCYSGWHCWGWLRLD